MKKLFLFLLLWFTLPAIAQDCPPEGDATTVAKKEMNKKKNKEIDIHDPGEAEELPLKNLLPKSKRKNDKDYWWEGAFVVTEGYLVDYEEQGPESCNCKQASKSEKTGDVHMFLGLVPGAAKKNCLVIEITPHFKEKYPDYEELLVKKAKIRVWGYLFYDFPHEKDAYTTCKACTHIWRKTPWEIHPITDIEILELPEEDD